MSILAWIVLSLISGLIDSKLVNKTDEGLTYGLVNWGLLALGKAELMLRLHGKSGSARSEPIVRGTAVLTTSWRQGRPCARAPLLTVEFLAAHSGFVLLMAKWAVKSNGEISNP